ncbi:hypothetical protein DTL21_06890 [Bremerella cremea]|uniref:Uncharacterized protein n=1 Tax=Blastopirellula marina TaxID=124 RepID=A0A2S8FZQ4_9BACT|nr:hypothetical protein C5Y83_06890 [Blastopirellula marina]RCS50053.1 hypothetical protein DTL21_06890 [Bremerella cremea]
MRPPDAVPRATNLKSVCHGHPAEQMWGIGNLGLPASSVCRDIVCEPIQIETLAKRVTIVYHRSRAVGFSKLALLLLRLR